MRDAGYAMRVTRDKRDERDERDERDGRGEQRFKVRSSRLPASRIPHPVSRIPYPELRVSPFPARLTFLIRL